MIKVTTFSHILKNFSYVRGKASHTMRLGFTQASSSPRQKTQNQGMKWNGFLLRRKQWNSELDHLALSLLISSRFKMLTPLNGKHPLRPAVGFHTFKPQYNLFCGLCLFPENWFCLTTIATLLPIVSPISLRVQGLFAFLVLRHFVRLVLAALFAKSSAGFREVHRRAALSFQLGFSDDKGRWDPSAERS